MDIVSHALVGRIIAVREEEKIDVFWIPFFAALPDFFQIPIYLFLGYINNRPFYIPLNSDWFGIREHYPNLMMLWEIPHSLFFVAFMIIPLVLLLKLNKLTILAYLSHIFIDVLTHTGEWSIKPLFPINYKIEGFTDGWAWKPVFFVFSWIALGVIYFLSKFVLKRNQSMK
jgi:membrane-bound metal-dependent hydrolase YbcI (DUF457 family)